MRTDPEVTGRSPETTRATVDLPGPVGAEQGHDAPGRDGEAHVEQGAVGAVGGAHVVDLEGRRLAGRGAGAGAGAAWVVTPVIPR